MSSERASILFATPPAGASARFTEHLGAAFLRAVLARAGIHARQYLPARNPTLRGFADLLGEVGPVMVGLTAYESNLRACRALVRTVREVLPEAVVVIGGPNATFTPQETLDLLGADLCVRGAAEGTITEIARSILGAEAPRRQLPGLLASVRNLVGREGEATWSTPAGDLSSFPGPPYRTLDDLPSPYQDGLLASADVGLLSARGCNQHCTYCSFAAISGHRIHFHGVDRVLDDLAALKALAGRTCRRHQVIPILDDAFTLSPERARNICEGIVRRGLELPLECCTRADRVDGSLLRLMKCAGFVEVSFGLESAVPRILRAVGKVQAPEVANDPGFEAEREFLERMRSAVAAARVAGLRPTVSVIAGLPGETAEDLRSTLAFVASLGVESYTHNLLQVLPGTPLHRDRQRYGIRVGRQPVTGDWSTDHVDEILSVPALPQSDRHRALWTEARRTADALCGRPVPEGADDDAAWAVLLHGGEPCARSAAWLREVLAVNGVVVVLDRVGAPEAELREAWLRVLEEAAVPWGMVVKLAREDCQPGWTRWRSEGTHGPHRFRISTEPTAADDGARQSVDGTWHLPVWVASQSTTPPRLPAEGLPRGGWWLVADGCRWWRRGRRCARPHVLHVGADGLVRPCWGGPPIGLIGDGYQGLAARGRALGSDAGAGDGACPLGVGEPPPELAARAEAAEVAAQLGWVAQCAR